MICEICPHRCNLQDGEIGLCGARKNINGRIVNLTYGKVRIAGIPLEELWEYRGEPFRIDTVLKVQYMPKIYRFVVTKKNSWRMVIPKQIVDSLGMDRNTHYLLFYSTNPDYLIFFFYSFGEVMRVLNFTIPSEKKEEESIPQNGREGMIYSLKVRGMLINALMKVWSSRSRNTTLYGITVPKEVVERMNINSNTLFVILYSPESNIMILELKNMEGGKRAEKAPYREKEEERVEEQVGEVSM